MTYFVYILRCRTGEFYTGYTNDIAKRLEAHRRGTASKFTRSRLPVSLVYRERCASRSRALRREAQIKRMKRVRKLELIESAPAVSDG